MEGASVTEDECAKTKQENQLLLKKLHDVVARYRQLQQQYKVVQTEKEQLLDGAATMRTSTGSDAGAEAEAVAAAVSVEMAAQDAAVKKLEAEKHELIEKLKHVVGTCRVMQKQLQEAKEENEVLKSPAKPPSLLAAGEDASTTSSQSAAFAAAARVQTLEKALTVMEDEKNELVTKLQEVISRYHSLQMQLEEKIVEHDVAKSKVAALELELRTREATETARAAANATVVTELEGKVEKLSSKLELAEVHGSVLKEENGRLKDQLASIIEDKQQQEREARQQLQGKEVENDRLIGKVSDLQHQVAAMQQQQEESEQLYMEVATKLNQMLRQNGDLELQLTESLQKLEHGATNVDETSVSRIQELEMLLEQAQMRSNELQSYWEREDGHWQQDRVGLVEQVNALSRANKIANTRIKELEDLQEQLEDEAKYEIISPTIDFPKREEIKALAEQCKKTQLLKSSSNKISRPNTKRSATR
uniref:Uncharacterized protein n=1 Tax=Globisporangium ultimum (strain ATCC 200006 / CBS 805.95 / DAOM BR144) TaxID=431595 RepID=K3WBM8_GLOUD